MSDIDEIKDEDIFIVGSDYCMQCFRPDIKVHRVRVLKNLGPGDKHVGVFLCEFCSEKDGDTQQLIKNILYSLREMHMEEI